MQLSCIIIAAPQGRSGKTIISTGLCAAFVRRGLVVQPFKKGPDYIDPSWLTAASGRSCRNIDPYLMTQKKWLSSFSHACQRADLAIIEGAMGLYDSLNSEGQGSTAHVARLLQAPVILVVNAARMTRSIAAMIIGYKQFESETNIAGVILNNVSGNRHEMKLRAAVEQYCDIPVLGSVPNDCNLNITQRHLGLIPYKEVQDSASVTNRICDSIEDYLDLDRILIIARGAKCNSTTNIQRASQKRTLVRIGVVHDRVFNFYYPENLEALNQSGANLIFIDSLQDQQLPDIDGLYIGGGFPELFLDKLEANINLRKDIAQAIEDGLPVYAECAGLMYLCHGIRWHDQLYKMVGVIPSEVELCHSPQGHGYVMTEVTGDNPLFPVGVTLRGHQFHYSRLIPSADLKFAYVMRRGQGVDGNLDAIVYKNVLAAYTHLHATGIPQWAESFVSLVMQRKRQASFLIS